MPSLRKRVSTYFRQLSFHNEPRQKKHNINENAFVTKYLQGHISLKDGPPIIYGKNPTDLPNYELAKYETGYESIISCYSGPHGGLTTVKRIEKHLSIPDADDFDFIDTQVENVQPTIPVKTPNRTPGQPVDNTKMVIKVAGQEYFVKNDTKKHRKSLSLGSISDFNIEIEKTKIDRECYSERKTETNDERNKKTSNGISKDNTNEKSKDKMEDKNTSKVRNSQKEPRTNQNKNLEKEVKYRPPKARRSVSRNESQSKRQSTHSINSQKNFELAKSKSEGNPFRHKGVRKVVERPKCGSAASQTGSNDDKLPQEWNKKSDFVYGISDSLYDTNLVTKVKNGDPIADCFGVISRKDSVILAVADGVNWGEKACIAAKSAIHGCLHYLNKTIFNDTKLFENLVVMSDQQATSPTITEPLTHISNTREVFICLLRAFNCAHDLILENNGMLTTLTVAIVLPLSRDSRISKEGAEFNREEQKYVCCVCNVGDTLAYIYSGTYGVRELTKGSHDITSNRDMRDALGALGPVDGINPELSNLTLSITTLNKGDIVMVASDGLTDNFDPSVCRFTVNTTKINPADNKETSRRPQTSEKQQTSIPPSNCPVKPPRRSHLNRDDRADSEESKSSKRSEDSASNSSNANNVVNEKTKEAPRKDEDLMENPLIAHFMKQNSVDETDRRKETDVSFAVGKTSNSEKKGYTQKTTTSGVPKNSQNKASPSHRPQQNYSFLRSKTTIDFHSTSKKPILRNEEGIPYITPVQRYELQLLLMEDVLKHGISGQEPPCRTSRRLCENLVNYTISITAAKRRTLEDMDLYFDNRDGVLVEISPMEKKQRRKQGLEKVLNLPGKMDHVTVVACNVAHSPVDI